MTTAFALSLDDLAALFPAYIFTSEDLRILRTGPSVVQQFPDLESGLKLTDIFGVDRPVGGFDPHRAAQARTRLILRHHKSGMLLRGMVISVNGAFLLCLGHAPNSVATAQVQGLSFEDFSVADSSLDTLMSVELQKSLIAEQRTLISDLSRSKLAAEAADRAKSEFLANMSHEIRTPLTAIVGFSSLLAEVPDLPKVALGYGRRIAEGSRSLLAVVNQILDWSKLEDGGLELEPENFNPIDLARNCLGLVSGQVGDKSVSLYLDSDASLPDALRADANRLRQVLMNLLNNAIKFTNTGEIRLSMTYEPVHQRLSICVSDTGCGIPAERLPKLFNRFTQADSSIRRKFGGTGLGLAIAKQIVEAMDGEITAQSVVGQGTKFDFSLVAPPALVDAQTQTESQSKLTLDTAETARVLVADDNIANRELFQVILRALGHQCDLVEDGRKAVDMALTHPYDLILMDIQMPEFDGLAATAAIREAAGPNQDKPILAISANASAGEMGQWRAAGMDDYIAKPVAIHDLAQKVAMWAVRSRDPHKAATQEAEFHLTLAERTAQGRKRPSV
ncbi:MAG: hypothetical protein CGW95_04935 [Phenylobacterium zucineum]|nr:MAG: hypothetical protein CGW95_04935 [Phenylobacterium zucineum]